MTWSLFRSKPAAAAARPEGTDEYARLVSIVSVAHLPFDNVVNNDRSHWVKAGLLGPDLTHLQKKIDALGAAVRAERDRAAEKLVGAQMRGQSLEGLRDEVTRGFQLVYTHHLAEGNLKDHLDRLFYNREPLTDLSRGNPSSLTPILAQSAFDDMIAATRKAVSRRGDLGITG
jgi:hypothetical protein